ncbi:MAG: aminoglycoside adenylyltransferase domain-containing protein, partial [Acidimicrobiia bacterium]
GGTTFPDRPRRAGDLDFCAAIASATPEERDPSVWTGDAGSRPQRIVSAQGALAHDTGFAFDTLYLLHDEIGGGTPPTDAFAQGRRRVGWAVLRAHWLAGQYVHLRGRRPEDLVVAPTVSELRLALDRELEHLERHVFEGDADDPYEATYALWNGCRILYTLETGSPVISKRSAGTWGLEHLPATWHRAIRAAGRAYDGEATDGDNEVLRRTMAPFVAMVRERLPITEPRPPGPPRWS